MKTVCVRNIEIGAGRPKIAVSITGSSQDTILRRAAALRDLPVDIAEWRMDCFSGVSDGSAVQSCLSALRNTLGDLPLLATFRTAREGGQQYLSAEHYEALNEYVLSSGKVDLLDLELFTEKSSLLRLMSGAHSAGVPVVLSNHDFEKTPSHREMVDRLCHMQEMGGDILKLAVMPRCRGDVLTLLSATEEMYSYHAKRPLITISMGTLGRISRLCGGHFGSAVTFGAASAASAPGQIPVEKLDQILTLFASIPE